MTSTAEHTREELKKKQSKEPIYILTTEPFSIRKIPARIKQFFISFLKSIFSFGGHGQHAKHSADRIAAGLVRAAKELKQPLILNPSLARLHGTVIVLGNQVALKTAIKLKEQGKITTLIAGPAVAQSPDDGNRIIASPRIDVVLVMHEWIKHWWASFDQYFERAATIWTPGVKDEGEKRDPEGICLVYAKNADEKVFHGLMAHLWDHNIQIAVSRFGSFDETEYSKMLSQTKFLLYISDAETDGHELRQAWMANIPSLAYDPKGTGAGAPGMTTECGRVFSSAEAFPVALESFLRDYESFTPRQTALERYSETKAAQHLFGIASQAAEQTKKSGESL